MASDEELTELIQEAMSDIDFFTGQFFEPRRKIIVHSGKNTRWFEPQYPIIKLHSVSFNGEVQPIEYFKFVGCPAMPGFTSPEFYITKNRFPKGSYNVEIDADWGYTEDDGSDMGKTPPAIRRACIDIVKLKLPGFEELKENWRIIEEKTRDQKYKVSDTFNPAPYTGIPSIDRTLRRYTKRITMGAV